MITALQEIIDELAPDLKVQINKNGDVCYVKINFSSWFSIDEGFWALLDLEDRSKTIGQRILDMLYEMQDKINKDIERIENGTAKT